MDRAFPFGFPGPTAFYLTLYVITLIVHVLLMNYVLVGTGYLAIAGIGRWVRRSGRAGSEPASDGLFDILRDWMPFALGATITAAIAPLLFLQILYREQFYTANLLLFHRWMSILPVLIVGFYLLYLIRSKWMVKRLATAKSFGSGGALACATVGAFVCFAFTGYAWTENHLLSLDRASWPGHYESRAMIYRNPLVAARFLMWAAGSVATMATILGWQVLRTGIKGAGIKGLRDDTEPDPSTISPAVQRLANLALIGIVLSFVAGSAYWWFQHSGSVEDNAAFRLQEPLTRPYFYLAIAGALVQLAAWGLVLRRGQLLTRYLGVATAGLLATIIGVTVLREAVRLHAIDITALYGQHAQAAQIGGWWVLVFFVAVNAGLIAYCIRLVRRGTSVGGAPTAE